MIHHVFPYDPRHLGLNADGWIQAQLGRWPLAAVRHTVACDRTFVHFIGPRASRRVKDGLTLIEHRALLSGPKWRDWGDDWSGSLKRLVSRLGAEDLCILHMDSYDTAIRVHHLVRKCPLVVVLHGRGFGGAHIRDADAIVALRREVGEQLRSEGYPSERLIVAPPSIDRGLFAARHSKGSPPPLKLGFVGTISPSKGTREVLATARLLSERGVWFSLDMLGTGIARDLDEMHRAAQTFDGDSRIVVHGHLAPEAVAERMAHWHLLLQPSFSEGYGIAVLEALSTGLPVVAVRGVFPAEMERQAGVFTTARDDYARLVADDFSSMARSSCGTELLIDHRDGAALWNQLERITRRGRIPQAPASMSRLWRLRPLRAAVHDQTGMRGLIRAMRRRLGPLGGLQ